MKNSKPACGKIAWPKKEKVIEIDLIERNFAELDEKGFTMVKGSNGKAYRIIMEK